MGYNMKCKKNQKKLHLLSLNALDCSQTEKIKKHLKTCSECREIYNQLMQKAGVFRIKEKKLSIDPNIDRMILSKMKQKMEESEKADLFFSNKIRWVLALSFIFIAVLGLFFYYSNFYNSNALGELYTGNHVILNQKRIKKVQKLFKSADLYIPENSSAKIIKKDKYKIDLYADTRIMIKKIKDDYYIKMNNGTGYFDIKKEKKMKIETINTLIYITGTRFKLQVDENKLITKIDLEEGSLRVFNKANLKNEIIIKSGEKVKVVNKKKPVIIKIPSVSKQKKPSVIQGKVLLTDGTVYSGDIINQNDDFILLKTDKEKIKINNQDIKKIEIQKIY